MTSPLATALSYAQTLGPVFPCQWQGERRKQPLLASPGLHLASKDPAQITAWWRRCPQALIGLPTGRASGRNVLDVDVKPARPAEGKRPAQPLTFGFDTLADLGLILPETPMVLTPGDPGGLGSGLHLHFSTEGHTIRGTNGNRGRGIGPGLDWRGEGNYVIVPSEGSGYSWDPHNGPDTPLAAILPELLPRVLERKVSEPVESVDGLSPYARAALNSACRNIVAAANGEQEATLNSECFAIGSLAGARAISEGFALRTLLWAASQLPDYDPCRPWRAGELEDKVRRAFTHGLSRPREVRRYA